MTRLDVGRGSSTLENLNIASDSDPRFFGLQKASPRIVTINFCKKARLTIWGLSIKISETIAKFVLKNGIVSLVSLFAIFKLAAENTFSKIKYKNNFSQTISKYPFWVTRVTILKRRRWYCKWFVPRLD